MVNAAGSSVAALACLGAGGGTDRDIYWCWFVLLRYIVDGTLCAQSIDDVFHEGIGAVESQLVL